MPCADPGFPERGEVFEEFVGVVYGSAHLSDQGVVFLCTHSALDGVSSLQAGGILPALHYALVCMPPPIWLVLVYVRLPPLLLGDVLYPFLLCVPGIVGAHPLWMT